MRHYIKAVSIYLTILCSLASCGENYKNRQQAKAIVEVYGSDNPELIKLYDYAVEQNDADILFLMANMVNKFHDEDMEYIDENGKVNRKKNPVSDLKTLNADSVITSVKHSRMVWDQMPWAKMYPKEYFREYVLPYHQYDYELKSPSKEYIYSKSFEGFDEKTGIVHNARTVNEQAAKLPDIPIYLCDHWTRFSVSAMRSVGLPAAEHTITKWGDSPIGHSSPALLLPDGSFIHFEEAGLPKNTLVRPMPKLFRKMYSVQDNTIVYKYRNKESIPTAFALHNLKDVTDKFPIYTRDIKITIPEDRNTKNKILYLSTMAREGWVPVAYAEKKGRTALFRHMGTGHQANGDFISTGRDMGKGIVYMPAFYINDQVVPVDYPMIVGKEEDRVRMLKPDTEDKQTLVLTRKFPLKTNTVVHLYDMIGGMFEASSEPDFEQRDTLYTIYETPKSTFQTIEVESDKEYKFVRYRMPSYGKWSIAELRVFDPQGDTIPVDRWLVHDEFSNKYEFIEQLVDNDPNKYITTEPSFDVWGGVQFVEPTKIARLEFCPRTDGNDIFPGDEYELLYWDNRWISMGVQIAKGYELTYRDVPSNALYWLRNHTKGEEERSFTYENGKQIWW